MGFWIGDCGLFHVFSPLKLTPIIRRTTVSARTSAVCCAAASRRPVCRCDGRRMRAAIRRGRAIQICGGIGCPCRVLRAVSSAGQTRLYCAALRPRRHDRDEQRAASRCRAAARPGRSGLVVVAVVLLLCVLFFCCFFFKKNGLAIFTEAEPQTTSPQPLKFPASGPPFEGY